ncbi:MAG TPA: response regulator transcription factor [Chitinophagales bacterium]|jgi:two-component system nitrate/nitrite response regulator NarL|nr:response regulator transcription factor [Chitinophagales bacterium]HQV77469.1 response regulator transcription factor [Chitinophagales bacterium]HQW78531.1 response regulator transcription factor [Chitinophagales bacterium]HRB19988.1 response regulator transcription factor [Chitinophagales bacterium]HRB68335.1 response regulator transcription factor [Chitinophagales bacterium]
MNTKKINIIIIDDHQMMIDGLVAILSTNPDLKILKTYTNGNDFLNEIDNLQPDIVLSDISMPQIDGYELTKNIKQKNKSIHVIALSMSNNINDINKMIDAGIAGYVLKNVGNKELINAIQKVSNGKMHFSDDVTEEMVKYKNDKPIKEIEQAKLTERELEILKLIVQEFSNAEIADTLFISERTVETHRKNMIRKFNTKTIVGLIKYAMDKKLI